MTAIFFGPGEEVAQAANSITTPRRIAERFTLPPVNHQKHPLLQVLDLRSAFEESNRFSSISRSERQIRCGIWLPTIFSIPHSIVLSGSSFAVAEIAETSACNAPAVTTCFDEVTQADDKKSSTPRAEAAPLTSAVPRGGKLVRLMAEWQA